MREVVARLDITRSGVRRLVSVGQLNPEKRTTELGSEYLVFQKEEVELVAERRAAEACGPKLARPGPKPKPPKLKSEKEETPRSE